MLTYHYVVTLSCLPPTFRLPKRLSGKESACNAGDMGSIPRLGQSPGESNGNLLQYPCLWNSVDRGAWWGIVQVVAKRVGPKLSNTHTHTHTHSAFSPENPQFLWYFKTSSLSCYWESHWSICWARDFDFVPEGSLSSTSLDTPLLIKL